MAARVLGAKLALHDVDDVEGIAGRVLGERLREWRASLPPHLREDALAFLIATAWELSERYEAERGISFSAYCYRGLRLRLVDWYRATFGDSRYGQRPETLSLDLELELEDAFGSNRRGETGAELQRKLEDPVDVAEAALRAMGLGIEWGTISLPGLATVREIGIPLSTGDSLETIARRLGESRRRVETRIAELKDELLEQNAGLPGWFG